MEVSGSNARVICNPTSGGGRDLAAVREKLADFDAEWVETQEAGDAQKSAREWDGGLLVVIGGDGTINEVVNGLGIAGFPDGVTLAIWPMGTGNDLARTLEIPSDPEKTERIIRDRRVRELDVARIRPEGAKEHFFINAATGGVGADISDQADEEMKSKWGSLAYLRASLETARNFEAKDVKVTLDGEEHTMRAANVAVGNCRYVGGGWLAAPRANPEDGLLDLVVIEALGLQEILSLAPAALSSSNYLDKEGVFSGRAREISIQTSPGGLTFDADGETIGDEPADFSVVPRALKVIVGPDYTPEPEA